MKMREIADVAGVSLTAVSLVLNGKPGIGEGKRAQIACLLQENGYQRFFRRESPGAFGKSLHRRRDFARHGAC